jgi:hypothetical protein
VSADSFYSLKTTTLQGQPADLSQYAGKVTLVVNVASQCGFTPQYTGLEKVYEEFSGRGFAVLGFPSNDFGSQEPGSADEIASFTYTGNLNLINNAPGSGNILTFMNSAGGVLSAFTVGSAAALNVAMSNPGFGLATLMDFTASSGGLTGTITHDDGISLFQGGVNQIPLSASAPTVSVPTNFTALPGTYHLWYVEVNGDPAQLTMNAVPAPEPASLALMGTALIGLTLIAKRRKSN